MKHWPDAGPRCLARTHRCMRCFPLVSWTMMLVLSSSELGIRGAASAHLYLITFPKALVYVPPSVFIKNNVTPQWQTVLVIRASPVLLLLSLIASLCGCRPGRQMCARNKSSAS